LLRLTPPNRKERVKNGRHAVLYLSNGLESKR
jgi:hypothetical protein